MFCRACGGELDRQAPAACPACGARHWNDAKPCACVMVASGSRLLMVRRAREPWKGCWDLPGGFCEPGEHPVETAVREVLEETGLHVRVTGFLGMWLDEYAEADTIEPKRTLNIYYHAVAAAGTILSIDHAEISAAQFFDVSELPVPLAFACHVPAALEAWKRAMQAGALTTDLFDRPD